MHEHHAAPTPPPPNHFNMRLEPLPVHQSSGASFTPQVPAITIAYRDRSLTPQTELRLPTSRLCGQHPSVLWAELRVIGS